MNEERYIFLDKENLKDLNQKGNTVFIDDEGNEVFLQVEGMQ